VLDPFIQDREGNVPDDRDLFTPGHRGIEELKVQKSSSTNYNVIALSCFLADFALLNAAEFFQRPMIVFD
jgi:hypothetical protein